MPRSERNLPRAASFSLAMSLARRSALRNAVTGTASLVSLSIMMRHADAAVGVASAGNLPPLAVRSVHQIGKVGEGAHEADGEPVAGGLAQTGLILHIVGHVAQGVALRLRGARRLRLRHGR